MQLKLNTLRWLKAANDCGPKCPPSAPPAIPPIIISPFSYQGPAPAIDPFRTPPGPPVMPPPRPRQRAFAATRWAPCG